MFLENLLVFVYFPSLIYLATYCYLVHLTVPFLLETGHCLSIILCDVT